jgi:hypothetical protein
LVKKERGAWKGLSEPSLRKKLHPETEPYQKGNVTIILDLKNVDWFDLVDLVKYLSRNRLGALVEVHIGNEVFDA